MLVKVLIFCVAVPLSHLGVLGACTIMDVNLLEVGIILVNLDSRMQMRLVVCLVRNWSIAVIIWAVFYFTEGHFSKLNFEKN